MKRQGNYGKKMVWLAVAVGVLMGGGGTTKADFTFGEPINLGPMVNGSSGDWVPSISADGLTLYFNSDRPNGYGSHDLWVTTRPTIYDPWGTPENLGPTVNSSAHEAFPSISADGLSLFFESPRPGGHGGYDLWVTTRATKDDPWTEPVNVGPMVNSSSNDATPGISADGLSLFFESDRSGGYGNFDILVTTRTTPDADWSAPVNLGATVNSSAWDGGPRISGDGLVLFFMSRRPGGSGNYDLYVTTRATIDDDWGIPVNLGPTVNRSVGEVPGSISADGLLLFFDSDQPGGVGDVDLWQAPILPVVDLNGDGIVDAQDMCIMVDYWGTDEPLCDIGPMPWGDGIVDVQDLVVLGEHLFGDVYDPTLAAHWPLDEAQGVIAYSSAADCDGTLIGDPIWRPDGGMVAGALQFDGIDDCISTEFVLNPALGPFSVFAWIKGGAPGQVLISQVDGVNWLMIDALEGTLATELVPPAGRFPVQPLVSDAVIADDIWHRVAFVWDGANRSLYVDGTLVAQDEQSSLAECRGGLNIGCGATLELGSFFSGLIDDVRIYNRAVKP